MGYCTLPQPPPPIREYILTYIDVSQADIYSHGLSERILGKALTHLRIPRNRVVIMTKCFVGVCDEHDRLQQTSIADTRRNDGQQWVNRVGLSRKHIMDAVDDSVRRLGTYIDVLQIHRLDRETPREEIMRALNDVVESGKVRYIGASSVSPRKSKMKRKKKVNGIRWLRGNSKHCKTLPSGMAGILLFPCKTTTTCSHVKKSAKWCRTVKTRESG